MGAKTLTPSIGLMLSIKRASVAHVEESRRLSLSINPTRVRNETRKKLSSLVQAPAGVKEDGSDDENDDEYDIGVGDGDLNEEIAISARKTSDDRRISMATGGGSDRRLSMAKRGSLQVPRRDSVIAIRRGSLMALNANANAAVTEDDLLASSSMRLSPGKNVGPKAPSLFHAAPTSVFANDSDSGMDTDEEEEKLKLAQRKIDAQLKAGSRLERQASKLGATGSSRQVARLERQASKLGANGSSRQVARLERQASKLDRNAAEPANVAISPRDSRDSRGSTAKEAATNSGPTMSPTPPAQPSPSSAQARNTAANAPGRRIVDAHQDQYHRSPAALSQMVEQDPPDDDDDHEKDANGVPAGQQKSMLCHEAKAQTPANEEKKDNEEDEYGDDSDFE